MTAVLVNGAARQLPDGTTLEALVREMSNRPSGVAAAINGDVVPRGAWADVTVVDGDEVEVLTAVQGG